MMMKDTICFSPSVVIAVDGTSTVPLSSATPSSLSQSNTFQSSNSPADSLGVMVQVSIKTIRVWLELECGGGVADVFGTGGGRRGSAFAQTYQEYIARVAQLDANICFYLKVVACFQ